MKRKTESGVAIVEFAFVLPLLVLLLFGTIEFSVILYDKAVLTNASREGARYGILISQDRSNVANWKSDIANIASNYSRNNLVSFRSASPPTVNVTVPSDNSLPNTFPNPLTVNITYTYSYYVLFGFRSSFNTLTLGATTTMNLE